MRRIVVKQKQSSDEGTAPQPPRRTTLKDVARAAGVSHQTVSRAINDKGEIDPQTRQRVLDAARELRYRPSRFARGLVRPDVTTVGLIIPDVANPFYPEFIAGVIEAAGNRGWQVVVGSTQSDRDGELVLLRSLGRQVDALIGFLTHTDAELAPYLEGLPLVVMDRHQSTGHGAVDVDVKPGLRQGLDHLMAGGHRRIGMIDCFNGCGEYRRDSFRAVTEDLGLTLDPSWIVLAEESMAGGEAAFEKLRTRHPDVTAVIGYNDLVAIGAFRAARRMGLAVPGDCALLGFDGLSIGELLDPPLSTVYIDKRRMGQLAIDQVDGLLSGTPTAPAVLSTELLRRGST
jgi:LacI family transcriptional regulator